jgi:hypothetical protein
LLALSHDQYLDDLGHAGDDPDTAEAPPVASGEAGQGGSLGFGFVAPPAQTTSRGDSGVPGEAVAAARESVDHLRTQRLDDEQRGAELARGDQVNLWSASDRVAGDDFECPAVDGGERCSR